MIGFIISMLLALGWLGYETNWLTVRLVVGVTSLPDWPEILRQGAEADMPTKITEPYPISHYTSNVACFPLTKAYLIRVNRTMRNFEPIIEVALDGKTFYKANGDGKRGDIKTAVNSQYAYNKGRIKIIRE